MSRLFKSVILVLLALAVLLPAGVFADSYPDAEWYRFQNSDVNNGVTSVELPGSYDEAALKWGRKMVPGYTESFTPPLIIGSYIYTASKTRVYKIDKENGDVKAESAEMDINVSYAMHPMTYCKEKGLLFVPLLNGRVQCLDVRDLSLKWISKTYMSHQALSPVIYNDGKVYTGTWEKETTDGVYFCLDAETGKTVWEFRPSEQKTETKGRVLGDFVKPTGQDQPDNFYTYTALIRVKAADGYAFTQDDEGKYWLTDNSGNKIIPDGVKEKGLIQCTVNGHAARLEQDADGSFVIRAVFDYSSNKFTQEGSIDWESAAAVTELDVPKIAADLDTAALASTGFTIESIEWKSGDVPHGFYWAGAYVHGDAVIFGSDDGQNNVLADAGSGSYTDTSVLYSVNKNTGVLIDKIEGCSGDIRSTAVFHDGYVYFTSKGGGLYKVKLNDDGSFDHDSVSSFRFDGMMTASPVVHNGRIYVGVSGTGGQFNADGGHLFAVLRDNEKLSGSYTSKLPKEYNGALIYATKIAGYPQASPLLSTGASDGKVRLYFTFNAQPGGIYYLEDSAQSTGESHSEAKLLFKPEQEMRQYCLSPMCVDTAGTIYIKNDSGYLMAVALNKAYLPSLDPDSGIHGIEVTSEDDEFDWNEPFESGTLNYTLKAPNGVDHADIKLDVPDGMTAYINGEQYTGSAYRVPVSEDASAVTVTVRKSEGGKLFQRTYTLNMSVANNNANLAGLVINDSNTAPSFMVDYGDKHTNNVGIGFDPMFDAGSMEYVSRKYGGTKTFVNVWVQTDDEGATVKAYPMDSVGNNLAYTEEDGSLFTKASGRAVRIPVYWIKGKISSEIKIVVTPPSGREDAKKTYDITLVRTDDNLDIGNEVLSLSVSDADLYTSGGDRTFSIRAMYGEKDVTDDCTWYSSKPDVVTVDSAGNVAAQDKEGDALVWACYGAQDTENRPCSVRVRNNVCAAPQAGLEPGTYDSVRNVALTTSTAEATIRYNLGEGGEAVGRPDAKSTAYTMPITLGEAGKLKRYKIRAAAFREGYGSSATSDFDYVIDMRSKIASIDISGSASPETDKELDTAVTASDSVVVKSVKWYEVSRNAGSETETEVSGLAHGDKDYRVKIVLAPSDEKTNKLTAATTVRSGAAYITAALGEDGTLTASIDYSTEPRPVRSIALTGVTFPECGKEFNNSVVATTPGVEIVSACWKDAERNVVAAADGGDGSAAQKAAYNADYTFHVTVRAADEYSIDDAVTATITASDAASAAAYPADVVKNGDGSFDISVSCRTAKLKVDTSDGSGVKAVPERIGDLPNGISINDIRAALAADVKASVRTEDGEEVLIGGENIFWDEDTIAAAYDPEALNAESFAATGKVTLPDDLDPNGSSLTVSVRVDVAQGVCAVPVMTPGNGTYGAPQLVTMSSATKGAGIFYTRSDADDTLVYEEPILLSGEPGEIIEYKLKMFAMKNNVSSETVTYTITIDRTAEAADASKHRLDKITPDELAAQRAEQKSGFGPVRSLTCTGNASKKTFTASFKAVSGAVNYRIEYRKAGAPTWNYAWTKGKVTVTVKGLKKGTLYEVKVAPYIIVDNYWRRGAWAYTYCYLAGTTAKLTAGKKTVTAKVSKVSGATGYKVRYSQKKNMKGAKTKTFKGAAKTKLKVAGLKSKKIYYVQVAPYKKNGSKTYVGSWTSVKKIKVK